MFQSVIVSRIILFLKQCTGRFEPQKAVKWIWGVLYVLLGVAVLSYKVPEGVFLKLAESEFGVHTQVKNTVNDLFLL